MQENKQLEIIRVSFTATSEDWVKFRDLSKKFGWNINTVFTKMFYDSIRFMEINKPQLDDVKLRLKDLI